MKTAAPAQRVKLLRLLVARHAIDTVPTLLDTAKDASASVRVAAMEALGQLAGPELVARLARLILDAKDTAAREEAEKSLMLIAQRDTKVNIDKRALPLLDVMASLDEKDRTTLFSVLGRIGGKPALKVIEEALADNNPARSAAALRALCNWPDGSVAPRLVELALTAKNPADRKLVVDALIRVAPLPDKRSDAQRLAMLERAMELASSVEQKNLILKRAPAIRSLETLRFVAPYMDQPEFSQAACKAAVGLAHHKALRQPNKAEFNKVLDKVIALSKDSKLIDEAKAYQNDQTWLGKQIQGGK
jgi:HEAT repeat protein